MILQNRLRVLMLGWEFPPVVNGGLGVACLGLARALAKRVDLRVVAPMADATSAAGFRVGGFGDGEFGEALSALRKRCRRGEFARIERVAVRLDPYAGGEAGEGAPAGWLAGGGLYGGDLGGKVAAFSGLATRAAMREKDGFDLIHAHDWMTFPAALALKAASGRPLAVHIHSLEYDRSGGRRGGWIYEIERQAMERADRVIPVSRYTGEIIAGHYGIDPEKIRPVHNGVEPVEAFRTPKKFPEPLVLFLGRLTEQKGPEAFLGIAGKVLGSHPEVRFVMAGDGERLRHLIESRASRGLGGKFHFTGMLDRAGVRRLFSMADIYCMPSVSEPFGLSALEAAQFGVPAVISKQSGAAEILKSSLSADCRDIGTMARHICRLLDDEELRARVARRQTRDIAGATWEAAARKVLAVYREMDAAHPA